MKSLKILLPVFLALAALIWPAANTTAAPPTPSLVEEGIISSNGDNKLPSVAVGNGVVNVAWAASGNAYFEDRAEESGTFGRARLGSIGGSSTYFNAATAVGADGTVHYAWIEGGGTIHYMNKRLGQGWSGIYTPAVGQRFANSLDLTVQGNSNVFISWRLEDGGIAFAYSGNSGGSWPIITRVPMPYNSYAGTPHLASGPNGTVVLTWAGEDGSIYVGQWNGQNFPNICVSCIRYGATNTFFQPSIAVGPDGQPRVIWYNANGGVYYAVRQADGTWGLSRAFSDSGVPPGGVAIAVDSRSNLHLAWIGKEPGSNSLNVRYAVKTPTEDFSTPITVSRDGSAYKANLDIAVSAKQGYTVAHIAWESFAGGQYIRYGRVRTNGIGCTGGASMEAEGQASAPRSTGLYLNPVYVPLISKPVPPPVNPVC